MNGGVSKLERAAKNSSGGLNVGYWHTEDVKYKKKKKHPKTNERQWAEFGKCRQEPKTTTKRWKHTNQPIGQNNKRMKLMKGFELYWQRRLLWQPTTGKRTIAMAISIASAKTTIKKQVVVAKRRKRTGKRQQQRVRQEQWEEEVTGRGSNARITGFVR